MAPPKRPDPPEPRYLKEPLGTGSVPLVVLGIVIAYLAILVH